MSDLYRPEPTLSELEQLREELAEPNTELADEQQARAAISEARTKILKRPEEN